LTKTITTICAGMDIGGSHVTAALHDARTGALVEHSLEHAPVDSSGPADDILDAWAETLKRTLAHGSNKQLLGVGIAMPGPFEYDLGISRIQGLAKYESLFGMNVRTELKQRLGLETSTPVLFRNDASCFLLGECWVGVASDSNRAIGITLGTGFGSAFEADGELIDDGPDVPAGGWLYHLPFRGRTAEDWFSGRGLQQIAKESGARDYPSLRDYAEAVRSGAESQDGFERYGALMGEFLAPWVARFVPDVLVVGGNISRSLELFEPTLRSSLQSSIPIRASQLLEKAALAGAASLPLHLGEPDIAAP
jgi:glucokinase